MLDPWSADVKKQFQLKIIRWAVYLSDLLTLALIYI